MTHRSLGIALPASLSILFAGPVNAQPQNQVPRASIVRILDAPPAPQVIISQDRSKLLMLEPEALPARLDPNQSEIWLAGIGINPRNTAPNRLTTYTALIARPIGRGETRRIVIPWKARVANAIWAPDGDKIAFSVVEESGISLWTADPWSGESRMLQGPVLNGSLGNPCQWLHGSDGLLCLKAVPRQSAEIEQYFTSQLTVIPISGSERAVGSPGVYSRVELSPDGRYLLVESLQGPFTPKSSPAPTSTRLEIWDAGGAVLKLLSERGRPPGGADLAPKGPNSYQWRNDAPATLVWLDPQTAETAPATAAAPAPPAGGVRDRMLQLEAPFSATPTTLFDAQGRIQRTVWGRSDLAIVSETVAGTGQTRTWVIDPSMVGGAPKLLTESPVDARFPAPGEFIMSRARNGRMVLHTSKDGNSVFLAGIGPSLEGDRPFLDRVDLSFRKPTRLWRAEGTSYEEVVALLDADGGRAITVRESAAEAPNYFIRDLKKGAVGAGRLTTLTEFKVTSPEFSGITRQLLTYRRKDGVTLSATLYLPAGYRAAQGRLPFVLWANPREFRSARSASQLSGSPYRFSTAADAPWLYFLLNGYGVLNIDGLPIVSETGMASAQRYREQLVAGATAAVEKLVAMGVADPRRIGIGGDSTGRAAAASLLAHSDLFRAGVAEAEQEGDGRATTVLIKPADPASRPLLTLLPRSGGVRTRESVGRRLTEMTDWMDRYVKGAGKP